MTAAVRYEWRRLTTLRSTWWLAGLGILVPGLLSMLIAFAISPEDVLSEGAFSTEIVITQGAAAGFVPLLIAYGVSLFGVFCFGHEYRHGMIRATLAAVPRRGHVFAAKTLMTALFTAVVSLLSVLFSLMWAAFLLPSSATIGSSEVWGVITGVVVYSVLFSLVGLALSAIFRNQVAALSFMFIVPTVAEQVIRLVLVLPDGLNDIEGAAKFLPFDAGGQMYNRLDLGEALQVFGYSPLDPVPGGVVFAVFTALLLVLASVLFFKRDV